MTALAAYTGMFKINEDSTKLIALEHVLRMEVSVLDA
jgi:hypothetical protein